MSYVAQHFLVDMMLPPFGTFLLLLLAFVLVRRRPRTGWGIAILAVLLHLGAAMPVFAEWIDGPPRPVDAHAARPDAEAIVVLGGGRNLHAPEYGGETASYWSLERARYAAKLQRETGLPILVSGGRPGDRGVRTEADIIAGILRDEFGVPVRWTETESHDTRENARNTAALLQQHGVQRVLLVTHASHMDRALALFREAGVDAVPMATGYMRPLMDSPYAWIPSFYGFDRNREWMRERLAHANPF